MLFVKGQGVNILGSAGHLVLVTALNSALVV